MGVEDDIKRFEDWAMSLGCPRNALPPSNDLVRVFSTGQALAFEELMRRVQPKQIVQRTRDEVIVKKMERIDGTMVSAKRMIPEQLRKYQKKKKLEQQLAEATACIEAKKKEFTYLSTAIKNKNIQKKQLIERIDSVTAKHSIYHMKINEIEQQQAEENEIAAKLDQVMPVKFSLENGKPEIAEAALAAAFAELQKFYAEYDHNNRYEVNSTARSKILDSLHNIFAHIPNVVLWNSLSKQMEQKVLLVDGLAKNDMAKYLSRTSSSEGPKLEVTKLYAKHMRLFIQKHKIKKESESSVTEYVLYYNSFLANMRAKFCMYNSVEIGDELLGEFMAGFSALSYIKGEMEYLKKVIADNEIEIQHRRKLHEDDRIATEALRQTYKDIEEAYFQVRDDMTALVHVKGKIMHTKNSMQYLLQCKTDQQFSVLGNSTMRANKSGNSINLNGSCESVFSSTMSDSFEKTELRSVPVVTIPNYTNEIKAYINIPIEVFKLKSPLEWELDFGNNPLLKLSNYISLPDKVKALIGDHLVAPRRSLEQLAYDHNWLATMKQPVKDIPCSIELPIVDETKLAHIKRQQDEEIAELSDRTTAIFAHIAHTMSNVREYLNLFKNNPLAKYIPNTKLVNGMSYQDYEREYLMYYNMVQNDE